VQLPAAAPPLGYDFIGLRHCSDPFGRHASRSIVSATTPGGDVRMARDVGRVLTARADPLVVGSTSAAGFGLAALRPKRPLHVTTSHLLRRLGTLVPLDPAIKGD
jgi:hypothetical protein